MLHNYKELPNGVVTQVDRHPYKYDYDYSDSNNRFGENAKRISYLRLGYIVGAIGFIPKSLIDVGYGNGDFLEAAKNIIPNVYGNDVTDSYPLPEGCEFVHDIYADEYDIATFFDVLEHLPDPYEIKNLKARYISVSLPWFQKNLGDSWFENWKHRKPDEHLNFFDAKSLTLFMDEVDYEPISITNIEDAIRKNTGQDYENILCGIFKKKQNV